MLENREGNCTVTHNRGMKMKATELDTKEVTVTRTEKRYVLNEKVFDLDNCPDWLSTQLWIMMVLQPGLAVRRFLQQTTGGKQ